jgi:hypothetical protein
MYKYFTQFIPKDTPPKDAEDILTVDFTYNSLDEQEVEKRAYEVARKNKGVDRYALRNHWEIFQTEVKHSNPPWSGFEDLVSHLMSYDVAQEWKNVENHLHIIVDEDSVNDYINKVSSYYKPLNPRLNVTAVVTVDVSPRMG